MSQPDSLRANYAASQELMDLVRYTAETLSLSFTRWDEQYVTGPSLYCLLTSSRA